MWFSAVSASSRFSPASLACACFAGEGRRSYPPKGHGVQAGGGLEGRLPKRCPQVGHGRARGAAAGVGHGDGHPWQHVHHGRGTAEQGDSSILVVVIVVIVVNSW